MMAYRRGQNFQDKLVKSIIWSKHTKRQNFLSKLQNGNFSCLEYGHCNSIIKEISLIIHIWANNIKLEGNALVDQAM